VCAPVDRGPAIAAGRPEPGACSTQAEESKDRDNNDDQTDDVDD